MIHFLGSIDSSVLEYLYSIRSYPVTQLFLALTSFGGNVVVIGLTVVIGVYLAWYRRFSDAAGLFTAVLGSGFALLLLKYLVHRPRPSEMYQAYPEGPFYSFPSAHAGLSMALYGFLIYLLLQNSPTNIRRFVIACLPFLVLLVGFSRLYLGVHYLSDVVAGFAVGAIFVWLGVLARLHLLTRLGSHRE